MIKTVPQTNSSTAQEVDLAKMQSPTRICMHVLGTARTDFRVLREASALVEAGLETSIVDIEGDNASSIEEDIGAVRLKHVIMPGTFISERRWSLFRAAQLFIRSILRLLSTQADVYHAHDVSALPACYIAARLRRKPLVFDSHELPLSERPLYEMGRSRRLLQQLLTIFLKGMISYCSEVITVSPPIVEEIQARFHIPNVTLIRNVPAHQIVQKSDRLRSQLKLGAEARIALYQGVLHAERGLGQLIRAAKFLAQNIVIVMMGDGPKGVLSELLSLIDNEGVADRVKILSAVPYKELLEWTTSADIGLIIYPPDYSLNVQMCLPNKLFEYLMAGIPILSSQLDAVGDIITTYGVGQIVSSLVPEEVGAAINAMLENPVALEQMRNNALKAAQDCCWEKESQELLKLYDRILSK